MNSLRARLVVAFALVAVVPLAIAFAVLSGRIRSTVRGQAADRLASTLDVLRSRLRAEVEQSEERLRVLAADAELKRRLLVPSAAGELPELLARERFLLGLDVLFATGAEGNTVADAASAPSSLAGERPPRRAPERIDPEGPRLAVAPDAAGTALVVLARAPVLYQGARAGWVAGGVALDSTRLVDLARAAGVGLVLRDAAGRTIAVTPVANAERGSVLTREAPLDLGAPPHATMVGVASTSAADAAIRALAVAALVVAGVGLLVAFALGAFGSWQVSRPVERLARFSQRIARGAWDEPLQVESVRELETLVDSLERMRRDLADYRRRLVAGERHAAWSLMARQIAHEVRNPLTPIAVSVADLKRSYEQRREDFPAVLDQAVATIGEEVRSLKALLHEFAEFGRIPEPRPETFPLRDLMTDIATLYAGDVTAGRLVVALPGEDRLRADRAQLRQALVNLVQNGLEVTGAAGRVEVSTASADGEVELRVADDGPGLTPEQRAKLFVPHFTTKPHGSGLGLAIVERIVSDHGGTVAVDSAPGRGTTFRVRLPRDGAPGADQHAATEGREPGSARGRQPGASKGRKPAT